MRKTTLTRWVPRPTFGGLVGGAAVLLLLTAGTAYAANEWNGSNIVDGSLTTADIANNNLTGTDIANGSISIFDLAPDAVNSARILDTSVANADLAGGAVTAQKMAPNSVNTSKIVNGTITTDDVADGSLTGTDVGDGSLTGADVADDSITSADVQALDGDLDIIDNTITTFDIATDAIDSDEVLDFGLSNQDVGVLFAEVNGDGTLATSSGSVTSFSLSTGSYEVDFGRDVTACTAVGTVGPSGAGAAQGELNVADRAGNPNAVYVDTNASDGTATALPFRLVVVC